MKPFVVGLGEVGLPWERLFRDARLPVLIMDDPSEFVVERFAWRLCGLAAQRSGLRDFGLFAARAHSVLRTEPAVVEAVRRAPSVLHSLRKLSVETARVSSYSEFRVRPTANGIFVCHNRWVGTEGEYQVELYLLMLMTQIVESLVGPGWSPPEILVSPTNAPLVANSEEFHACRVLQNLHFTAIKVPSADLVRAPRQPVMAVGDPHRARPMPNDPLDSIRAALHAYLPEGRPAIDLAAEIADMSQRTFQRRLAESGISYRQLLDEVCFEEARARLDTGEGNITDVAFDLGFSNVAAFTRAFHRWSGMSPRRYREEVQEADEPTRYDSRSKSAA